MSSSERKWVFIFTVILFTVRTGYSADVMSHIKENIAESIFLPVTIFLTILLFVVIIVQRKRIRSFEQKVVSSHDILEVSLNRTKREVERVRQACELASLIYFEYDIKKGIFTGDRRFYELIAGEVRDYLTLNEIIDQIHPDDLPLMNAYRNVSQKELAVTDDNVSKVIGRVYDSKGRMHYMHVYAKSVFDNEGKLICRRGSMLDVTDQKNRERELSIINKQFEYIQSITKIYNWEINIYDPDYIRINKNFQILLGDNYKDVDRVKTSMLCEVLSDEDYNTVINGVNDCYLENKSFDITVPVYPKNGANVMYIHLVAFASSDTPDIEKGVITGVIQDITDIKNAERKAGHEEKIKALGRLASDVAHDFNNQLSGIVGYAELIREEDTSAKVSEYADIIAGRGEKLSDLVRKLLDYSRSQKEDIEMINLDELISDTVSFFLHLSGSVIEVGKEIKSKGLGVLGNYLELQNAILNLCINSRDSLAGEPGMIVLKIDSQAVSSEMAQKLEVYPGKYAVLSVSDNGHGMTDAVREKVLEPFFTTKPEGKGTGLGLSAVHGVILAMAGGIEIISSPGEGTTVKMYLPIASENVVKTRELRRKRAIRQGAGHVYVIDDDKSLVKLLTMQLNKAGYSVTGNNNPVEAVANYAKNYQNYDLVILDMVMPEMNGAEVYSELKRINSDVSVIVMSAYSDDELLDKAKRAGIEHFLQKPVTLSNLTKIIAEVLDDEDQEGVNEV